MKFGLAVALTVIATPGWAEPAPGYARIENTSRQERPLALSVWYPSDSEATVEVGGNAVFTGTPASADAPAPAGSRPLIVLSHGGLRSAADSGAWLASSLAEAGAIVVEVNAPRPGSAAAAVQEIWERPRDISRAVDTVLDHARWADAIDGSRIAVVGYALGGTAALSAAGATLDVDRYAGSCLEDGAGGPDCAWYAAQGITSDDMRKRSHTEPLHDPRVTSAVAIMPEYIWAFDMPVATLAPSTLLLSLGEGRAAGRQATFDGDVTVPGAAGSDAFAVCTEAGPAILIEEEGDAAICGASQEDRRLAHKAIADAITLFLLDGAARPDAP